MKIILTEQQFKRVLLKESSTYKASPEWLWKMTYNNSQNKDILGDNKNSLFPYFEASAELLSDTRKEIIEYLKSKESDIHSKDGKIFEGFSSDDYITIAKKVYSNPSLQTSISNIIKNSIESLNTITSLKLKTAWTFSSKGPIMESLRKQVKDIIKRDAWSVEQVLGRASENREKKNGYHLWDNLISNLNIDTIVNNIYTTLNDVIKL